jgi:hypothetical protein
MQLILKKIIYYMLFWGFVLEISSCAKVGSLQGGPEDLTPPKMDTLRSTPNYTTNFKGRSIELRFNEWIELADVPKQVVISPPFAKRPTITLKGKVVRIKLEDNEVLRPNTTYTINFGTAVKDFTKGNPCKDLRFVFSTGDKLDNLEVIGSVADALTGDPMENISVLLYDNLSDSVIRKERPYYLAQTDKIGQFAIKNVKPGQFKAVAIEDANANLTWERNEKIAFLDQNIEVRDSGTTALKFVLSKEQQAFKLLDKESNKYGNVRLVYSEPPTQITPITTLSNLKYLIERGGDTLTIWYDLPESNTATTWNLLVGTDTIRVKTLKREDFLKNKKITYSGESTAAPSAAKGRGNRTPATTTNTPVKKTPTNYIKNFNHNPYKPLILDFAVPISAVNKEKWLFTQDSIETSLQNYCTDADSLNARKLRFTHSWALGKKYALTLLPGALTDYWGSSNMDTLRRTITVLTDKQLASMVVTLKGLNANKNYFLQLLNGTVIEATVAFKTTETSYKTSFDNLPLGTYTLKVTEEALVNGRWDAGDYFLHRQPERTFTKKLEPLVPNFELDVTFDVGVKEVVKAEKNGGKRK